MLAGSEKGPTEDADILNLSSLRRRPQPKKVSTSERVGRLAICDRNLMLPVNLVPIVIHFFLGGGIGHSPGHLAEQKHLTGMQRPKTGC